MPSFVIPLKVLTEQVAEAIDGRRVRSAVFTTFSFDPGFFEINILPVLFDQPFSQPDKVRRLQLEDALRTIDHVAVYYDRRALAQDGEPAQLDYRRLDVSRTTGYFHPKVVLLLVDDRHEGEKAAHSNEEGDEAIRQALIVAILSANLTRAGWWENVECAHVEEIKDRDVDDERCSFRPDLLSLIRGIRQSASDSDDHTALDKISEFLFRRTQRSHFGKNKSSGKYHTRMFGGQSRETLSDWLWQLSLNTHGLNLEVISPFFDPRGEGPLRELIDAVQPREVRVYHPTGSDGESLVTRETYEAVKALDSTRWATLPGDVVNRGRDDASERLAHYRVRFVTAAELVTLLVEAQQQGRLQRKLDQLARFDVVILDELGYVPFDKAGADLLFGFISQRYERRSLVVTTNLPFARWSEVFLDATPAAAVIDRIVHHATVLTIAGDSYRLKVATRNQASRATQEVPRQ